MPEQHGMIREEKHLTWSLSFFVLVPQVEEKLKITVKVSEKWRKLL